MFEITVVGEASFRVVVEADLDVGKLHLQRLGKSGEAAQRPGRHGLGVFNVRQA